MFFLAHVDSIFIHVILAKKKSLYYSLPESSDRDLNEKVLTVNFLLDGVSGPFTLLAFDKKCQTENILS